MVNAPKILWAVYCICKQLIINLQHYYMRILEVFLYTQLYLPTEEVTFATVYSWSPKERKVKWIRGWSPRDLGVQSYCPFTSWLRAPLDGWIVLHKCLSTEEIRRINHPAVQFNCCQTRDLESETESFLKGLITEVQLNNPFVVFEKEVHTQDTIKSEMIIK